MARADIDTYRRLPWKPNVAVLNSNLYVDGKPHPYCPRGNLLRMTELFAAEGYVLNCGFEPEHFLVVRTPEGGIRIWDPLEIDTLAKPCYDFKGMCQAMDYLQDVIRYGNKLGFEIYQSDHEDANGQYEINFGWTNALHAADRLTLFRMMTSQVAAQRGCIATYMAKPFNDKTGSAAHLHFHVADVKTGGNLFPGGAECCSAGWVFRPWPSIMWAGFSSISGPLRPSLPLRLTAIGAFRAANSSFRPLRATRGRRPSHLTATITEPSFTAAPNPNRFEDRSVSAPVTRTCSRRCTWQRAVDGIRNEIDPGEPCIGTNLYEMPFDERRRRGMTLLPQTLLESVMALEEDEVVKSALGPIADEFIRLKKSEWSEFMRYQVTPWEIKRYLTML